MNTIEDREFHSAPEIPAVDLLIDEERALSGALQHIIEAKNCAKPIPGEAELLMVGTLMPDRRLSNSDKLLEARINRVVRKRFRIGLLPGLRFPDQD